MDEQPAEEYRVEELAAAAGVPVRTLRYYQERRLLPPPERRGRTAWYSSAHLDRLRLIAELVERGHRLDGIEELLAAAGEGRGVVELLGFERAVTAPWAEQTPVEIGRDRLVELFGDQVTDATLAEAVELGYLRVEGGRVLHTSARLLEATAELVRAGIPLTAILPVAWELEAAFDRMAYGLVRLIRTHLIDRVAGPGTHPSGADLEGLAAVVDRLRPVARTVADEHFNRAMDRRVAKEMDDLRRDLRAGEEPPPA
ncbi:MerR family transcriptional regulator [Actinomadura parmotrematis]|uniref:MerR family transcriptional regulator n=1 Tax=Actinomadura parmotrematis TaxID=2864039 RepID=A0ABS7FUD7_9ACTN|nr:MerR family transcriptional regulator [Actinomadura parmotrematis]MBW8484022.1 MerR family transcriptional regulator [Actinomadura parmotrematis]